MFSPTLHLHSESRCPSTFSQTNDTLGCRISKPCRAHERRSDPTGPRVPLRGGKQRTIINTDGCSVRGGKQQTIVNTDGFVHATHEARGFGSYRNDSMSAETSRRRISAASLRIASHSSTGSICVRKSSGGITHNQATYTLRKTTERYRHLHRLPDPWQLVGAGLHNH